MYILYTYKCIFYIHIYFIYICIYITGISIMEVFGMQIDDVNVPVPNMFMFINVS